MFDYKELGLDDIDKTVKWAKRKEIVDMVVELVRLDKLVLMMGEIEMINWRNKFIQRK